MNLILFEPDELASPLPVADPRAQHLLKVLRRAPGDTFVAGLVNGPLGTATLLAAPPTGLALAFTPAQEPPPLPPITLLVGLPRPQTARDLLRDATTLGVSSIHFVATERSDPNYAASSLWTSGEYRRHLLAGAAQACDTRLPEVTWTHTLASALSLDSRLSTPDGSLTLALGPERGWGPADRDQLRAAGFTLCSLGQRVLRLETAAIAALPLARHARP